MEYFLHPDKLSVCSTTSFFFRIIFGLLRFFCRCVHVLVDISILSPVDPNLTLREIEISPQGYGTIAWRVRELPRYFLSIFVSFCGIRGSHVSSSEFRILLKVMQPRKPLRILPVRGSPDLIKLLYPPAILHCYQEDNMHYAISRGNRARGAESLFQLVTSSRA